MDMITAYMHAACMQDLTAPVFDEPSGDGSALGIIGCIADDSGDADPAPVRMNVYFIAIGGLTEIHDALAAAFPAMRNLRVTDNVYTIRVRYTHNAPGAPAEASVRQFLLDRYGPYAFQIPCVVSPEFPNYGLPRRLLKDDEPDGD